MRLPGRCALHAVATVTAASLLIATLAYKERDATAAAVNPSIDVGHMNALCVVGEWRTFAMPAVYNSVVNAARVWDADSFMFYHTRYDASQNTHPHRENATACAFDGTLLASFIVAKEMPLTDCSNVMKASIQFIQINTCFEYALAYEKRQQKQYKWLIRTRPDYLIYNPQPLPPLTRRVNKWRPWRASKAEAKALGGSQAKHPKPDMIFAIPRTKLGEWFSGMPKQCIDACCLEYTHKMFTSHAYNNWMQDGAIARGPGSLTYRTAHVKMVSGLTCNITSTPDGAANVRGVGQHQRVHKSTLVRRERHGERSPQNRTHIRKDQ